MQADAWKGLTEPRELTVLRPEIVPPLADAMGLVDCDELHVAPRQASQESIAPLAGKPLGRDIQQTVSTLAEAR